MTSSSSPTSRSRLAAVVLGLVTAAVGWWGAGLWTPASRPKNDRQPGGPNLATSGVTREVEAVLDAVTTEKSSSRQFSLLAAAAQPKTAGALRAWLDRIEALPNAEARDLAQQLLFRDGSGIPFEAMLTVLGESDYRAGSAMGRHWAEREGLPGLTRALSLTGVPASANVVSQMAGICAKTDPEGTLALLLKNSSLPGAASGFGNLFAEWVKTDPTQAVARLNSLTDSQRNSAVWSLVSAWAGTDPEKALAWAKGEAPERRYEMLDQVFSTWARTAPELAAEAMLKDAPEQLSRTGLNFSHEWSQRDPEGLLKWVNSQNEIPVKLQEHLLGQVAQRLASSDPERAWSIAEGLSSNARSNIMHAISRELFTKDPKAAMAWGERLNDRAERSQFYGAAGWMGGSASPEIREEIVSLLPDTDASAVGAKLSLLAKGDPAAALKYWENLPAEMKLTASRQGLHFIAESAPEVAALIIRDKLAAQAAQPPSASPQDSFASGDIETSRVAVALGTRDPAAAKEWITSLPPGPAAADAAANFAAHHGRFDRESIESWLAAEPADSPLRAGLVRGLARLEMGLGDPAAALAHLRAVPAEDKSRTRALEDVYRSWSASDPEQARQALAEFPLTDKERQSLNLSRSQ